MLWYAALARALIEPDVLRLTGPARRQPWRKTVELLPLLQHRLLRHDIVFLGACASSAADATAWRQTVALVTGGRRQGLASSVAQNVALGVAGTWQKGHHMLSGFQGLTLRRDAVSFSVALRRAPWLSTLEHFDATKRRGIPQNVVLASAPLSRPWFGAVLTLQHLERFGPQPDIVAYGSALSAAGAANWKESLALLQLSTCAGLRHNVVSITAAVVKAWQSANQLLESMRRWLRCDGLSVQRAISASLAAWRNALGLLASSEGDISSINAAMACDGLPWQRCLSLLPFHLADVLSFGSAIAAFAQGYDWVKASWLLRSMSLYGRQPSELCTNACLSALARTRRWRRAVQVLPQAVTDAVSYDTVIAAVPWSWSWSLHLLLEAARSRLQCSEEAMSSALGTCALAAAWCQAVCLWGRHVASADAAMLDRLALACESAAPQKLPGVLERLRKLWGLQRLWQLWQLRCLRPLRKLWWLWRLRRLQQLWRLRRLQQLWQLQQLQRLWWVWMQWLWMWKLHAHDGDVFRDVWHDAWWDDARDDAGGHVYDGYEPHDGDDGSNGIHGFSTWLWR